MVKKVRKFNYNKNLKKEWKKKKAKLHPEVNADNLKSFWDKKKSLLQNYQALGLAADPNISLAIPKAKSFLLPEVMDIDEAKKLNKAQKEQKEIDTPALRRLIKESQQKTEKRYDLNENDALFCIYMIEKYGENYKKMARDHKNHYQETDCQIKKKISLFMKNKEQYTKYLNDKKAGVNFLDKLDEKF